MGMGQIYLNPIDYMRAESAQWDGFFKDNAIPEPNDLEKAWISQLQKLLLEAQLSGKHELFTDGKYLTENFYVFCVTGSMERWCKSNDIEYTVSDEGVMLCWDD